MKEKRDIKSRLDKNKFRKEYTSEYVDNYGFFNFKPRNKYDLYYSRKKEKWELSTTSGDADYLSL